MARAMTAVLRAPRRTGTERLICLAGCDAASVYMTTAAIRRGPLPYCGECAARLCPEHPELAAEILEPARWEDHPYLDMSQRETWSAMRGQSAAVQRGRMAHIRTPDEIAGERVARAMRADAAARRAATLTQNAYRAAGAPEPFQVPDQLALDGSAPVPVLTTSASGTPAPLEDHETLSLFTPAPAVMTGQTTMEIA